MSIGELGALGEFLGSILTLVTLVYLAVQIRQKLRTSSTPPAEHSVDPVP